MSTLRVWAAALGLSLLVSLGACAEPERSEVDTRLETHTPLAGTPTAAGLAYVEAAARAHEQADAAGDEGVEILLAAVELERPTGDGIAEQMHYELLARSAELLVARGQGERALELLEPRLAPTMSLPVDRAAARCLVSLGDAAAQTGDLSLAMGSYARALDMLTLLLEEVEP